MKNKGLLTTAELLGMITSNLREINSLKIDDKRLPTSISRAKATSMGVQAAIKLALLHSKKNNNQKLLK